MRTVSWLALLTACGGGDAAKDGSTAPESKIVAFPTDIQGGAPAVVLRLTNASTIDPEVYAATNRLANDELDLEALLLMRGGLRTDDAGEPITPAEPDVAGTAVEQLASSVAAGGVVADAPDACGNTMLAAFVRPDMVQHAGGETGGALWPTACDGSADCDTLEHGIVEVVLSQIRFDGMMDVVVNIHPSVVEGTPALWGHLLSYWLTAEHPGFVQAPIVVNAEKFQLAMFNVWQRTKTYTHEGVGVRDVIVMPHAARTYTEEDLLVAFVPQQAEDCVERWGEDFGGIYPYGCADESPVLLDRNSVTGESVWTEYTAEGADPTNLKQLEKALVRQIQTSIACPPVTDATWVKDGPVELFTCPPELGDLATCMATVDLAEYACRPVEGTETDVTPLLPLAGDEAIPLAEQREPFVFRNDLLLPYTGPEAVFEITVDADTVLFLPEPERFTSIEGPTAGTVQLPVPLPNRHCEEEPPFRYEVGAEWAPGVYTFTAPWTVLSEELRLHVTSLESWKF